MEHIHADRRFPRRLAAVEHAYMLVYSRDMHRLAFQRIQMPMLGVDASLVTGYDLEELTAAHRTCVFGAGAAASPRSAARSRRLAAISVALPRADASGAAFCATGRSESVTCHASIRS